MLARLHTGIKTGQKCKVDHKPNDAYPFSPFSTLLATLKNTFQIFNLFALLCSTLAVQPHNCLATIKVTEVHEKNANKCNSH